MRVDPRRPAPPPSGPEKEQHFVFSVQRKGFCGGRSALMTTTSTTITASHGRLPRDCATRLPRSVVVVGKRKKAPRRLEDGSPAGVVAFGSPELH
uniref:Uncharacterized protein n=1 Tax=Panagrellus redivivus TaxID=6233 RepID=A0A7E4VXP1_PANRE